MDDIEYMDDFGSENEYEYNGYVIVEDDGYYYIGDYTFYSLDEAMEWVDTQNEVVTTEPTVPVRSVEHRYRFFYVDRATDRSFNVVISAPDFQAAKKKLYREYDVYTIADWYKID